MIINDVPLRAYDAGVGIEWMCGQVEGFTVEVVASGSFCPPHLVLPVNAAFYSEEPHPIW